MSFRISGLPPEPFRALYDLPGDVLGEQGVQRLRVDQCPGYPDRVTLREGRPGEYVLLLNYTHQPAATPYRASHAIFVLEGAETAYEAIDEVPEVLRERMISLRAFDQAHSMVDAALASGPNLVDSLERILSDDRISYIHAHYAARGCYAACINRA